MSCYNLFPRIAVRRPASLLFVRSLSFIFLVATALESFGQSQSGRPVARLITATSEPTQTQANHRSVVPVIASAPVAASSPERRAFDMINSERAKYGLPPLAWDGDLCRMARLHSEK